MAIAVERDGRIRGLRGTLIHDHGAYTARGVNVPYGSVAALTLAYVVRRCTSTSSSPSRTRRR